MCNIAVPPGEANSPVSTISYPHIAAELLLPICISLTMAGCFYAILAAWLVRGFAARRLPESVATPGVTVLKPLHGAEPGLRANLATFCRQDYGGPIIPPQEAEVFGGEVEC